jgi:tetratricopeptide (TPR) repeat protein
VGQLGPAAQAGVQTSLEKARQFELHGRIDLAEQAWQQVLLIDANNPEALAGLARAKKLAGELALSKYYEERLRAVNPNDPAIARIEAMSTQPSNAVLLKEAGLLAQQGRYAQAMDLYRKLYGTEPPPGNIALAYYETEAATEEGRAHAIDGLRSLAANNPGESSYQIALGRILTYNPRTRAEGRRLLAQYPSDRQAVEALRQSLLWDAQNPATAADIRAYVEKHPDAQLAEVLRDEPRHVTHAGAPLIPAQRAQAAVNATRSAANRAAYAQLAAHHIDRAEDQFKAILASKPDDPNALAGMGYIRMQQANFAGALNFLLQARQDGSKDPGLNAAIATSQFWNTMADGASSLNENDLAGAEREYRQALAMRPESPEALEALGGTLLRAQQPEAAAPYFVAFIKVRPTAAHAWRGLFLAQTQAGDLRSALLTDRQIPAPVRTELDQDPVFLRALASTYSAVGRDADAQRVLKMALDLPFPSDARGLETETQLQYAGLLAQANRMAQAAGLYRLVLKKDQNNVAAWQGLVRAEHDSGLNAQALDTLESTPPAIYAKVMRDAGFEATVASIYQAENRLDVAQDILEKSIAQQLSSGQKASVANELQLAGIYLQRNHPEMADPIYRRVLTEAPDRLDAWKGLLATLHSTGRDADAIAQVQQIPQTTRAQLETDPAFLETMAGVYNALGQPGEAAVFLRREQETFAFQHTLPPASVDIENGWLLYNAGDDAGLYRQLMELGGRADLSTEQRRTVQTIWANWAVRRANQAAARGDTRRALTILNATARAFPDNAGVIKALAGAEFELGLRIRLQSGDRRRACRLRQQGC